jgi:hypothetical protein
MRPNRDNYSEMGRLWAAHGPPTKPNGRAYLTPARPMGLWVWAMGRLRGPMGRVCRGLSGPPDQKRVTHAHPT